MKKLLIYLSIMMFLLLGIKVNAQEKKINVYLFYGKTCPVCAEERKYLDVLEKEKNINVIAKEVWYNEENQNYLNKILNTLEDNTTSVPITIIGETMINGYNDAIGNKIKRSITYYSNNEYIDMVKEIEKGTYIKKQTNDNFIKEEEKSDESLTINLPYFNNLNLKKLPISNATFLLGLVSSINIKLIIMFTFISYLFITCKSKKKAAIYGIIYILLTNILYIIIKDKNISSMYPIYLAVIIGLILICYEILMRKKDEADIKSINFIKVIVILFLLISTLGIVLNDKSNYYNYFIKLLEFNNIIGIKRILQYITYFIAISIINIIIYLIVIYTSINIDLKKIRNKIYIINYVIIIVINLLLVFNVN